MRYSLALTAIAAILSCCISGQSGWELTRDLKDTKDSVSDLVAGCDVRIAALREELTQCKEECVKKIGEYDQTVLRLSLELERSRARELDLWERSMALEEKMLAEKAAVSFLPKATHKLEISGYALGVAGVNGRHTALGEVPVPGITVAVSRDMKSWLGHWVWIEGIGMRKCTDLMDERFKNSMDVLFHDGVQALKWGRAVKPVLYFSSRSFDEFVNQE